ncbi:D-arabinitol 2-dehydrogenase [Apiospora marii]|uniref:D-arabinitol 2-dehydrogenase n=1 Tax=Apiospora marii TaxID=335849 RepID=A0ABR1REQ7_9PEZI
MSGVLPRLYRHVLPAGRLSCASTVRAPLSHLMPRVSMTSLTSNMAVATQFSKTFHSTPAPQTVDPIKHSPKALLPEFSLKDKVIIVSGGAQGLGLVQTEALLEAGAKGKSQPASRALLCFLLGLHVDLVTKTNLTLPPPLVHVFDRQAPPPAGSKYDAVAKRAVGELETTLTYHQIDVRLGAGDINRVTQEIADEHGRIDGLIAAAGIQQETPALEYTAEDSDRMLGINITGVLMTAQAVARQMVRLKQEGSLVFIASMSGTVANRGLICPVYNASKAGVIQLGRNLASEWGQHGIRVNTISPGYIVTDMVKALFEKFPEREVEWPKQNMLNKLSKPEDYRGAAVFLLSDASRFMTGADLRIDGGHAAW